MAEVVERLRFDPDVVVVVSVVVNFETDRIETDGIGRFDGKSTASATVLQRQRLHKSLGLLLKRGQPEQKIKNFVLR